MKTFNLSEWLQDKSRKVVTRTGEPVEIINHEVMGKYCIYAKATWQDGEIFNICTTSNGEAYEGEETAYDLFFADEEEELTEFEKAISEFIQKLTFNGNVLPSKEIKGYAKSLLDLARKELEANYYTKVLDDRMVFKSDLHDRDLQGAYEMGKRDALKDLPKWKKATEHKEFGVYVCVMDMDSYMFPFLDTEVNEGEYYIELSDLKVLPKEE